MFQWAWARDWPVHRSTLTKPTTSDKFHLTALERDNKTKTSGEKCNHRLGRCATHWIHFCPHIQITLFSYKRAPVVFKKKLLLFSTDFKDSLSRKKQCTSRPIKGWYYGNRTNVKINKILSHYHDLYREYLDYCLVYVLEQNIHEGKIKCPI